MSEKDSSFPGEMSLTKFLSASGVCSRRAVPEMIGGGRVCVNGETALRAAQHVTPSDVVTFDGHKVSPVQEKVYVMLHKPRGYVCTLEDSHAKKLAVDLITLKMRLVSAGRLDKDSEGLILFSNDGEFVNTLTHPRNQISKSYEVSVIPPFTPREITKLTCDGIMDEGDLLKARKVQRIGPGKYLFVLTEGKNREIRRMLQALGRETRRLKRVAVGGLQLGILPLGRWRRLTPEEILLAQKSIVPKTEKHQFTES